MHDSVIVNQLEALKYWLESVQQFVLRIVNFTVSPSASVQLDFQILQWLGVDKTLRNDSGPYQKWTLNMLVNLVLVLNRLVVEFVSPFGLAVHHDDVVWLVSNHLELFQDI